MTATPAAKNTTPTAHPMAARPWCSSAISACATVIANISKDAPTASRNMSSAVSSNVEPKKVRTAHGPSSVDADDRDDADGADREHEPLEAGAERGVLAHTPLTRQLREQRRLHGLEEVERHAREQQPGEEAAGGVVLGVGGEELHHDRPRVHEREREHRAAQEQSDVAGELVPRRRRPGLEHALLAPDGEPRWRGTA